MAKAKETQESPHSSDTTPSASLERSRSGQLTDDFGSFGGFRSGPFSFMRRFSEEMDRLFEEVTGSGWSGRLSSPRSYEPTAFAWSPQIETFQRGNEFLIRADLPGLNKDDVKVEVEGDCVAIQGERKREQTSQEGGGYRSERSYGKFYRCVRLPQGVQGDQVSATFRDGVLEVKMPAPEQKQARKVEITG